MKADDYAQALEIVIDSVDFLDGEMIRNAIGKIKIQETKILECYKQMSEYLSGEMSGIDKRAFEYEIAEYLEENG
jgi:hypothetical protein